MKFANHEFLKHKSWNLKYIASWGLAIILASMVGSQYFFVHNTLDKYLTAFIFLLTVYFSIRLVYTVRLEVRRKEEFQSMSNQLAKANDQLRKLDNAKTEFISIASHQLRTPLTAIKGFISLLLENSYGKITPRQQETLNKVYISNDRLIKLVEDLLNLSRLESGRMEFKLAPTRIEDLCQEAVDTFIIRARYGHLYLQCEKPAAKLPLLMIDAAKVREVVYYLVDNAIKYTAKGGIKITTEQLERDHEGGPECVRITIADTGIGISAEELPHLFAKFSRGKDTSRLNIGGTGIGLYVGRQIIEANGGKIWAESDGTNKGSRFIIELSVEQDEDILERWG